MSEPGKRAREIAQYWAWSWADHECGGRERGNCQACDNRADRLANAIQAALDAERAEEREACARLCDAHERQAKYEEEFQVGAYEDGGDADFYAGEAVAAETLAKVIRARGEVERG